LGRVGFRFFFGYSGGGFFLFSFKIQHNKIEKKSGDDGYECPSKTQESTDGDYGGGADRSQDSKKYAQF
jgi:hypothetical protein